MRQSFLFSFLRLVGSSFLVSLSFPNIFDIHGFSWLIWFSLIPLFITWEDAPIPQRLWTSALFGMSVSCLLFHWFWDWSIGGFFLAMTAFTAQMVVLAAGYHCKPRCAILSAVYVPALWTAGEYLRAQALGGLSWGIGHALAFNPQWIQWADMTGAYGISFLVVTVNVLIVRSVRTKRAGFLILAGALLGAVWAYGNSRIAANQSRDPTGPGYHICSLQPNISSKAKNDPHLILALADEHIALTSQCFVGHKPDLIVWPETALTDDVLRQPLLKQKTQRLLARIQTPLLIGSALQIDGQNYNSAVLFNRGGKPGGIYHKQKLVPLREYGQAGGSSRNFQAGQAPGLLIEGERPFGVVICSEDGYPALFRPLVNRQAQFIIVILNDAAFKAPWALAVHAQSSIMRAVEFRLPVIRTTNTGLSGYISPDGLFEGEMDSINQRKVFHFELADGPRASFYAKFGDIFAFLCALFVIMNLFAAGFNFFYKEGSGVRKGALKFFLRFFLTTGTLLTFTVPARGEGAVNRVQQQRQAATQQVMQQRALQQQAFAQQAMRERQQIIQQEALKHAVTQRARAQQEQIVQQQRAMVQQATYQRAREVQSNVQQQQMRLAQNQIRQQRAAQEAAMWQKRQAQQAAGLEESMRGQYRAEDIRETWARINDDYDEADVPQAADVIGLGEIWQELKISSEVWPYMIDIEPKELTVKKYIEWYRQKGISIRKEPAHYVEMIDSLSNDNPAMLQQPFAVLLKFIAIIEYDFDNGQDKDRLARQVLGEKLHQQNKERLGM